MVNPIEIGYIPISNTRKLLMVFNEPKGRSLRDQIEMFKENIVLRKHGLWVYLQYFRAPT
ncbi:MAG: hypothetical protein IRD7MM_06810 [Candidatus Midichloria mitochondrii]